MPSPQPGVVVTERALASPQGDVGSAIPLFIGYTERGSAFDLQVVPNFSSYLDVFGGPPDPTGAAASCVLYYAVRHYFDNGGGGGFALSLGSYDTAQIDEHFVLALSDARLREAISGQPHITLIMVPDSVVIPDADAASWQQTWRAVLGLCQCRPGLFGLLETPDDPLCLAACLADFTDPGGEWGAAYWPRLIVEDADNRRAVVIPPSTTLAVTIERNDEISGVWSAPANLELANVIKTTQSHLLAEPSGLWAPFNLIRSFPGRGTRAWGCRTLAPSPDAPMRYVQLRRLLSYIELNLTRLARMFVFEPNNEITWFKVKGQMSNWLHRLWQDGGLRGTEEQEAFDVALGLNETMTEADLLAGKMIARVRIAAMHPAEHIELSLQFDMPGGTGASLT
ncbi:phage tail sheath C-terminal domain-containing protein [Pseudoxanthomonas sp. UTMC 1351]|uniref:phage tail sheath C-terminal domain-containing protein n=1 Tax=Pseudoxanthomonas sp. UTMC 1351 TaxID=2695853 RepID=UPI0034CFD19D